MHSAKRLSLTSGGGKTDGLLKCGLYCANKHSGKYGNRHTLLKITQTLMSTENHNPVSESVSVSVEKTPECKTFAGMKLRSDNPIDPLFLQFKYLW